MKIKKYIAPNIREGKAQILEELGDEAVILSTRVCQDPKTNGEFVEIVAAIDDNLGKTLKVNQPKQEKKKLQEEILAKSIAHKPSIQPNKPKQTQAQSIISSLDKKHESNFDNQFSDIKSMISELSDIVRFKYKGSNDPIITSFHNKLLDNDFGENYSLKLISELIKKLPYNDKDEILYEARKIIVDPIKIANPLTKKNKRQILIFFGTTGCGKTTTLVKLAVITKLLLKSKIVIVSTDTYKVGGFEQLQTFASIAGINYHSVYTPEELDNIIHKEMDKDFIFIDTTGRNHKNQYHMKQLKEYVDASSADLRFLVQSVTTNSSTFSKIIKEFSVLDPNSMILTKFDEAETFGGIFNQFNNFKLPLSYITNGQKIPDDIEPVDKIKLGKLILPD